MLTKVANRPAGGSADESGGSQKPEGRALPLDVSNRLGLFDFGNIKEVQDLRSAGIEVINSERKRIEALNVLYDEMFSPAKRIAELKAIMGKNFIGPEHYQKLFPNMDLGEIPPIPEKLTDELLNSDCKLWDSKAVKDTHILAYVPATSIVEFIELAKNKDRRTFFSDNFVWLSAQDFATEKPTSGQWILMPRDIVPGTTDKNNADQNIVMAKYPDYKIANANPLAIAIAMNYLVNDQRIYTDYCRCEEMLYPGTRVIVGAFGIFGLGIGIHSEDDTTAKNILGSAAFRNL